MGTILAIGPASGGVSHAFGGTVGALRRRGWEVLERRPSETGSAAMAALRLARRNRTALRQAGVVHVEFGSNSRSVFWCAVVATTLRRDVVLMVHDPPLIAHSPGAGLIAHGSRWRMRIAYRILSPLLDRLLVRRVLQRAGAIAVLGREAQRAISKCTTRPVFQVALGVDFPSTRALPPSAGRHVLFAGYLGPGKGVDLLVDAWSAIPDPNVPLVIAGGASSTDETWVAGIRARAEGLEHPPLWTGPVRDELCFQDLFRQASIVVLPYRVSAPASGILVRAMSEGRCIVATRVTAAVHAIVPGVSGTLVDVGDATALAQEVTRLLHDDSERDRLGAGAACRSREIFGWDRLVDMLERAYIQASA